MSRLYNYFLSCWRNGTADETTLGNAVTKGYLTQDEANTIMETPKGSA